MGCQPQPSQNMVHVEKLVMCTKSAKETPTKLFELEEMGVKLQSNEDRYVKITRMGRWSKFLKGVMKQILKRQLFSLGWRVQGDAMLHMG